jgi:hypothetical protein
MSLQVIQDYLAENEGKSKDIVNDCDIAKSLIQHLPENEHELETDQNNGEIEINVTLFKKDACELMVRCIGALNISVVQKILRAVSEEDLNRTDIPENEVIDIVFTKENIKSIILMLVKNMVSVINK